MAQHERFTQETGMPVYFANPGSPWQRGTNENTNGLLREFFPKGTDFNKVSKEELKRVEELINTRPRKILGYTTPKECLADFQRLNHAQEIDLERHKNKGVIFNTLVYITSLTLKVCNFFS